MKCVYQGKCSRGIFCKCKSDEVTSLLCNFQWLLGMHWEGHPKPWAASEAPWAVAWLPPAIPPPHSPAAVPCTRSAHLFPLGISHLLPWLLLLMWVLAQCFPLLKGHFSASLPLPSHHPPHSHHEPLWHSGNYLVCLFDGGSILRLSHCWGLNCVPSPPPEKRSAEVLTPGNCGYDLIWNDQTVFPMAAPFSIPVSNPWGDWFLHTLSRTLLCLLGLSHPSGWAVGALP